MAKRVRWFPIVFLLLSVTLLSYTFEPAKTSNQQKTYFVQFRIIQPIDNRQSEEINTFMAVKPEINVSRTDFVTNTYFAVLNTGVVPNQSFFRDALKSIGYDISCFYFGEQFVDSVKSPHTLSSCTDEK